MIKLIRAVFALIVVSFLSACGGGGGSPGSVSGAALFTSASSTIRISPGEIQTYTIGGGVPSYTATSSSGAATVTVKNNIMTIVGGGGGTTTITITDAKGAVVTVGVTVGSGLALFTTASPTISVGVGASSSIYTIGGGSLIYAVTSSDSSVASVGVNGNQFVVNGNSVGKATIAVKDSIGALVSIDVTVGNAGSATPLFTTSSSDIIVLPGSTSTYTVGGGTAPYSASSNNPSVAGASISGTTLTINGLLTGTAKVQVSDAKGAPVIINVSVGTGASIPLFTTAPSAMTIGIGGSPGYTIGGGTGPYSAGSSNVTIATATVSGSSLTINGNSTGNAVIVITDNVGKTVQIAVTVIGTTSANLVVSPSTSASYVGDTLSFRIDGGSAPYSVTSNNSAIGTVSTSSVSASGGSFSVFSAKPGAVSIVVADSKGNAQTISITITAAVNTLALSPVAWNIDETNNATISLAIKGGNGPFQVFTSNTVLSNVSGTLPQAANPLTFDGTTVNVAVGTQGTRCVAADTNVTVTVKDSLNQSATSTMTIKDNSQSPGCMAPLSPSAVSIDETNNASITLTINNGVNTNAPFVVTTSNSVLSSVSVAGTTLTVGLGSQGTRCVPSDTPITITVTDSLNLSSTSTITIKDKNGLPGC